MTTLWLDHRNAELRHEPGALVPYVSGQRQRPVPLRLLRRVVIFGNCHLQAATLSVLAEAGISVAILSPRRSARRAWLIGPGHNDATVRLRQLRAVADEIFRRGIALQLIQAKVRRQLALVRHMRQQRPDAGLPLKKAEDILHGIHTTLQAAEAPDMNRDALRGLEGSASRAQFSALAAVLPASLGFQGRQRRPPPDPANALLSLSYTLLHHRAVQTAWALGLEPLLGFFHEPAHGRESLAADLIEPWRPEVDRWVWRLFAEQRLRPQHFATQADTSACLLGKAGRRIFYATFEEDLAPLFRALRLQVRALVRRIRQFEEHHAASRQT